MLFELALPFLEISVILKKKIMAKISSTDAGHNRLDLFRTKNLHFAFTFLYMKTKLFSEYSLIICS